jgi:hypothetical protein
VRLWGAKKRDLPNAEQLFDGEFNPDREHQQDDPYLGKQPVEFRIRERRARGERADENPAEHVPHDQRLTGKMSQRSSHEGTGQQQSEIDEQPGFFHEGAPEIEVERLV